MMPSRRARPALLLLAVLCGVLAVPPISPVRAQEAAASATQALAETVLTLAETAEVRRPAEELRVTLKAEARGAQAAAVQDQVNRAIQAALERARQVPGVQAHTGGYWTNHEVGPREGQARAWVASQRMTLSGTGGAALLELTGALQGQGLAVDGMEWSLSTKVQQEARQEAGRLAIEALRQRAAAVAAQLGMEVAGIRSLRLDAPEPVAPRAMMMRAAMPAAAGAAPPASAPEDVAVNSTAVADVVLRAKR